MSVTPLDLELQHNDLHIIDDGISITPDVVPAAALEVDEGHEPLLPFLMFGLVSLVAMLAIAVALAF